ALEHRRSRHPDQQRTQGRLLETRRSRAIWLALGCRRMGGECSRLGASDPPDRRLHRACTTELTHLNEGRWRPATELSKSVRGGRSALARQSRHQNEHAMACSPSQNAGASTCDSTCWEPATWLPAISKL